MNFASVVYIDQWLDHVQVNCGQKSIIDLKSDLQRSFPQYFTIHFTQLETVSES